MQNPRKLDVWEISFGLALDIYRATRYLPKHELYGLTIQTRRAATSIPINLSEGCGRGTDADFARFVHYAIGSANELECCLLLIGELGYATIPESIWTNLRTTHKKLRRLLRRLS